MHDQGSSSLTPQTTPDPDRFRGCLLGLAAECADVYVTSDLRHHRAGEHRNETDCALIDVAHWASEWPWLEQAAQFLVADTAGAVRTVVSTVCTDPWDASIQGSAVTEAP